MPEALVGVSSGVTAWLLTYLLHSSVLVAGAWLWSRFLRARPAVRDALWRVALLGGVVTATASMAAPLLSPDRVLTELEVHEGARRIRVVEIDTVTRLGRSPTSPDLATDVRELPGEARVAWKGGGVEASAECRSALATDRARGPQWLERVSEACGGGGPGAWGLLLPVVWLLGALVGLVALARGARALGDLERSFDPAGPRAQSVLASVARPGGRRPRLVASSALAAPCVLPGRRIGLPERCEAELGDAELRAVLAHEVAHLERADVLWTGLLRTLVALFWVQPLNRLALSCALQACEEVCDDRALARTGERLGLARSISRVAHWAACRPADPVPVSMAGRREGAVASRVRRILDEPLRPEPRWTRVAAGATLLLPLLWLPTVPVPGQHVTAIFVRERVLESSVQATTRPAGAQVDIRILVAKVVAD